MNANLMVNVAPKSIAIVPLTNALRLVHFVERVLLAPESLTTVLSVNAHQTTSEIQPSSAVLNATEMLIVPDRNPLASMESARILAMVPVALMLTVICEA